MLSADWHWDNPKCRLDILKRDLDLAKKHNAMVISAGDLFCAMQGKYDHRSSKDSIRPEHQRGSYLDRLVETAADFLAPYKDVMGLISDGNHETAIYKNHETCLTSRLVERLRSMGSQCRRGSYNGWLVFAARDTKNRPNAEAWKMYYHHGSGGDSPVTQGTISMSRTAMWVDADCILSGHIHTKNVSFMAREKCTGRGIRRVYETALVRVSTYKDEYSKLDGFHIEKGRGPRPTSNPSVWMKLRINGRKDMIEATFHDTPD